MYRNILKKMSLSLLAALLAVSVFAQTGAKTVTKSFSNTPLATVLAEIEAQTGFKFIYEIADVNAARKVSTTLKEASLKEALDKVLPADFSFSISGNIVTVKKDEVSAGQQARTNQKVTVTGTVVDSESLPVPGATVMIKNNISYGGTITDEKGHFSFTVPKGSTMLVSFVGFKDAEKVINGPVNWFVTLEDDSQMIEETVVVGYGVQKKESVVGAISQVDGQALVNSGTTNVTNSLAGKLSGVETFQTSGQPGANDATIQIRGISSWNGSEPLVMVDGVERSFNDIDPNEVETISVLKDASATAVFGAKGANGVILVTTKSGSKGKAKMNLTVNYGIDIPTFLPEQVAVTDLYGMANIALKNQQSFGSLYSSDIISTSRDGYNLLKYPNNNWNDLMIKNMAQTLDAGFSVSGGGEKVIYYAFVGYSNDNSILAENMSETGHSFRMDRINYRLNIDSKLTSTTTLSARVGGSTTIVMQPDKDATKLFSQIYKSSSVMYPAYYPAWALDKIADLDYPDAHEIRMADNGTASTANPFRYTAYDAYHEDTTYILNTDLIFKQDLNFITKGLSFKAKAALSTQYTRYSMQSWDAYADYLINWDAFEDKTGANPWSSSESGSYIYVKPPYSEAEYNDAKSIQKTFYWEGSLNYNRSFAEKHNVTALLLMHQRELRYSADFPYHTEAYVGRITYDYKNKYLFEANVGYTGSEQFAPANRYGIFPSIALGYTISKESWWKNAMPWWNKMKIRYSNGIVGSDHTKDNVRWLYYSTYKKDGDYYVEDKMANETARWETAHKRDLGIEMGWFKSALTLDIDLFDEYRKDMLLTPVITPLVAADYKDINIGEMKKHGFEAELKYRKTTSKGLYYEFGGMAGFNENRITKYSDDPSKVKYQWWEGTSFGAQMDGLNQADSGFFTSIDDLHSYPNPYATWNLTYPGIYKYSDYNSDGYIDSDDYHPIEGMKYPDLTYSFNAKLGYKGWTFSILFYGNAGKYSSFMGPYDTEFSDGDLLVHKSQLDFWTPTNSNASVHRIPSFISQFTTLKEDGVFEGHSWRRSDFLNLKEAYLAYRFDGDKLKSKFGIDGLTLTLTGNNLLTFTGLVEGDPQIKNLNNSYYPLVSIVKFGVKLDF